MRRSVQIKAITILILLIITICIWYAVIIEGRGKVLTVSFLDIGQGDAIFIEAPGGRQVLIDGGPGSTVLQRLSEVTRWYDRSLDVVIPTHPDADHISGFIDVLDRYNVSTIIRPSVEGDTKMWGTLLDAVKQEGAEEITAMRGQIVDLGGGAYLEILFPDRLVPKVETNTGCVVSRLVYGNTAFMFSCDAPQSIEKYLVALDGASLHSDVLKAGHHGSKTSSSELFVGYVDPDYAVFSRGCKNTYGHPSPEIVERFKDFNIPTLDTCTEGTITFVSDGVTVVRE